MAFSPIRNDKDMLKRIATAVVLIPIVMLLVLRAPVPVLAVFAAAVALVTVQEFLKLTESYGVQPLRLPTYIFVGLIFLLLALTAAGETPQLSALKFVLGLGFACALAPFVFLTISMRRAQMSGAYPAAAASAFAFVYIAVPMAMLVQLRQQWAGAFWLLYLLLVVWAGDIFAYFVGRSVGRHLMAPRISPKKTWEGAAASLAASLVVGSLLFTYALQISSFLLRVGLIERRDGLFGLEKPELWPVILLDGCAEYCGAAWRSGGIADQARSRREGLGHDSSRPRRHARPHRCSAVCRSRAVVLRGGSLPTRTSLVTRKMKTAHQYETHCHPGIDRLDRPQHAERG